MHVFQGETYIQVKHRVGIVCCKQVVKEKQQCSELLPCLVLFNFLIDEAVLQVYEQTVQYKEDRAAQKSHKQVIVIYADAVQGHCTVMIIFDATLVAD